MVTSIEALNQGLGCYTISEAARYARINKSTLYGWFFPKTDKRRKIINSRINSDSNHALSFLDLVEAMAIRSLRVDHKVSMNKIREAIDTCKKKFNIDHPFAHKHHKTYISGNELHILLNDENDPIGLTGKDKLQKSFKPCIEAYMRDLKFDTQGLAKLYNAYNFENQKIVIDPKNHGGMPMLPDYGYTAHTLWKAAVNEGSFDKAARNYDVSSKAVEAAYKYYNDILGFTN